MKEGLSVKKKWLSMKEGFTPTFSHKHRPKKTPPAPSTPAPIFFWQSHNHNHNKGRKDQREGQTNIQVNPFLYIKKIILLLPQFK